MGWGEGALGGRGGRMGGWVKSNDYRNKQIQYINPCTNLNRRGLKGMHGSVVQYHPTKISALSLCLKARLSNYVIYVIKY